MKKLLILMLVLLATTGYSQTQNVLYFPTAGFLSTVYWANDQQMAYVDGTSTTGDGGQGWYNWDAGSTATPDAFSIIQVVFDMTTVTDGRWIRRPMLGAGEITNVGTITTGVWDGTVISTSKGGTGLTALGTANQLLRVNASGTALEYYTPSGGAGDLVNGGNSTGATVVVGTNDANALSLETNGVVRATITGGASTGGAWTATDVTANTNTVEVMKTSIVNSTGTTATGFGMRHLYQLETSTTDGQDAASMDVLWGNGSHPNRTADIVFSNVYNANAITEKFRIAGMGNLTATGLSIQTAAIEDRLTLITNSTGTPAVGFGSGILFKGESSTTDAQDMARIATTWENVTHASRASRFLFQGVNNGAAIATFAEFRAANGGSFLFGASSPVTLSSFGLTTGSGFTVGNSAFSLTLGNSSGGIIATTSANSATAIVMNTTNTATTASGTIGNTTFANTTGTRYDWRFTSGLTVASGSGSFYNIFGNPTINQTSTASGVAGFMQLQPTLTSLTGGYNMILANPTYTASSGAGSTIFQNYTPTFNLTSTASGVQYFARINPTLTSLVSAGQFVGIDIPVSNANAIGINQTGSSTVNYFAGKTSYGSTTSPTAQVQFAAGTTSASSAPIKFVSGVANQTSLEAGALNYDGTNLYLSSGTANFTLAKVLTGSNTLDFGNTVRLNSTDLSITVTGASVGDPVSLGIDNASITTDGIFTAWVSATNTVTVRFTNVGLTLDRDPASGTFKVAVTKY